MTERQKRFCDEYLIDLNATQAAVRAGYKPEYAGTNANKLLNNTKILEHIKKRLDEKQDGLIATQDEILRQLTSTLRREEKESVVVVTKSRRSFYDAAGKKVIDEKEIPEVVQIPAKLSDVNRAAELLGKYHAIWTDRSQVENIGPVQIINDIPRGDSGG